MKLAGIEWDENKAAENFIKHKVSFETVQYVFFDPEKLERYDRSESNISGENRWQVVGKIEDILHPDLPRSLSDFSRI